MSALLPVSTFRLGDCREVLAGLPDASIDSIVTDPPYELGFMGKAWDASGIAYDAAMWGECLRVLKPGGHLLAFGGTRTYHRMTVAIEDAGFEIRDSIHWIYGSGFPKSLDVSKAIDKAAGAEREVLREKSYGLRNDGGYSGGLNTTKPRSESCEITAPATPEAAAWSGWGTALKPAHEPIVVARKPLVGTVAANVLAHGTGALNIDGCRIEGAPDSPGTTPATTNGNGVTHGAMTRVAFVPAAGRWPANVVFDEDAAAELDAQSGERPGMARGVLRRGATTGQSIGGSSAYGTADPQEAVAGYGDSGGASRFFYCAKAGAKERPVGPDGTKHATVKPLALMRWLVRLVTPPGGTVLDPFAGSGTTLEAALLEGFDCFGIEAEITHVPLVLDRIARARAA